MTPEIFETAIFFLLTGLGWFFAIKTVNKKNRILLLILVVIQVSFSTFYVYKLAYDSFGGMGLVWGLYFIFFNIGITLLLSIIGLFFYIKKRKH